jgi:hypothetical protein
LTTTSTAARPAYISSPAHRPTAAEPASPDYRTWSISTTGGVTITGYLPPWADEDPSDTDVPLEKLSVELIDLTHWQSFDGQTMHIHHPAHADGDGKAGEGEDTLFNGNITCYPYSEDLRERTPFANVRVVDDFWMNNSYPTTSPTSPLNSAPRPTASTRRYALPSSPPSPTGKPTTPSRPPTVSSLRPTRPRRTPLTSTIRAAWPAPGPGRV